MTKEELERYEFFQQLVKDGPDTWKVDKVEDLPSWYWELDVFPMNTGDVFGKIMIAPGHFCFWDGSGPRGRWSVDVEMQKENELPRGRYADETRDQHMKNINLEGAEASRYKSTAELRGKGAAFGQPDDYDEWKVSGMSARQWVEMKHSNGRMPIEDFDGNPILEIKSPTKIIGLETEGKMDPKYGGVLSYRVDKDGNHIDRFGDIISTPESRAKEDVPQWRQFELGRLEIVDNVVIPGPNALPKDEEKYGKNRKLTNVHKTRGVNVMPSEDSLINAIRNYCGETHYGKKHIKRWQRVLMALGDLPEDFGGWTPMTLEEVEKCFVKFNKHRWAPVVDKMRELAGGPEMEGVYERFPEGSRREAEIIATGIPYYCYSTYRTTRPPLPGETGWSVRDEDFLPDWYFDLPEVDNKEAFENGKYSSAAQVGVYYGQKIWVEKGKGVTARSKRSPALRLDLPMWSRKAAAKYYNEKGIRRYSLSWLDGPAMTRGGWTDNGQSNGKWVARAAICKEDESEAMRVVTVSNSMADMLSSREAVVESISDAIESGDWARVAKLAKEQIRK